MENDSRVVAAWLFGSLGRDTADELSDVDIFVIFADAQAETALSQRHEHIRALAKPLLVLDASQNRPPHGAYHMALYARQVGPHQVDWYWLPQTYACIPMSRLYKHTIPIPASIAPSAYRYLNLMEAAVRSAITTP